MQSSAIEFIPKIEPETLEVLSLIYTPGVGHSCLKIQEDEANSYLYTNRSNSVAVISFDYQASLKRAIFLKNTLNIDAYPFEITKDSIKLVVDNIEPNFCGIDLSLIEKDIQDLSFDVRVPVLKSSGTNIQDFFRPVSKNIFKFDINQLEGDFKSQSLFLREKAGGVIESELSLQPHKKPIAILSDGSAVLGFGNLGANSALPVMEGKAVIFKSVGAVNAIPLCVKTQDTQEIIKIAKALKNSFSGINIEDISAPRCFDIENKLMKELDIPVFHDDQHGTAIVVLAALFNALSVVHKDIDKVKIVINGAGAAAQATARLILKAGAKNIIMNDKDGIVYEKREVNDKYLNEIAKITNKDGLKGSLEDAIVNADVFIGLSAAGALKPELIKLMKKKPIIFALANPTPEIMPKEAKMAGGYIIATGRSDFDNQINNSLAFPGLFKGLLAHNINKVTDEIKIECSIAIASLVKDEDLSRKKILPTTLDGRVVAAITNRLSHFMM